MELAQWLHAWNKNGHWKYNYMFLNNNTTKTKKFFTYSYLQLIWIPPLFTTSTRYIAHALRYDLWDHETRVVVVLVISKWKSSSANRLNHEKKSSQNATGTDVSTSIKAVVRHQSVSAFEGSLFLLQLTTFIYQKWKRGVLLSLSCILAGKWVIAHH